MKLGDAEYTALVADFIVNGRLTKSQAKRIISQSEEKMHTHKTMSPEETQAEIAKVTDGAKSVFENITLTPPNSAEQLLDNPIPLIQKKRGRPKGSRNKPKVAL
jgi:uncharacterized protein (DUF2384 family)